MIQSEKIYDTGLRILEVLKILLERDVSKDEIIEKLKKNSNIGNVYTKEAFIKYFNTLEAMNFKISKSKNLYHMENSFYSINLTSEEKEIFRTILNHFNIFYNQEEEEICKSLIYRINKFFDEYIDKSTIDTIFAQEFKLNDTLKENIISTAKQIINDNLLVDIKYKKNKNTEEEITAEIKEIVERSGNIYINCYIPQSEINKKICIDLITSIKQSPQKKRKGFKRENIIIYELYGKLANSYKLKEGEKIVNFSKNVLTVSSSEKDREILIRRLLKYGENCKILKPKSLIREYEAMTEKMIKNLEED